MDLSAVKIEGFKSRIEHLKRKKGRLGRLVSEARIAGTSPANLVSELQSVSAEIKTLQKGLKHQKNAGHTVNKWNPPEINPQAAILGRTVEGPVTVRECDSELTQAVDNYVAAHPAASLWHRPVISAFINTLYGHPIRLFTALSSDGKVVGTIALVKLKSRLFGTYLVSLPYFNYGGILADNQKVAEALISAADSWREKEFASHVELRHVLDLEQNLPQRSSKFAFWLPLPETPDALWTSFKPKLRAQIRRGERERPEVIFGGVEQLDAFYRVFSRNMRDLGTPVYGRDFFRGLLQSLPGQSWLVILSVQDRPVGCAFLVGYRGRLEIPWASTLRTVSHTAINMAMYWNILKFAVAQGYTVFDFGRCTEDAGTYHFKKQWGAQPIKLHWDYLLAPGVPLPGLNPDNPKFRFLIAVWKKLPVWIANILGPKIVRVLP